MNKPNHTTPQGRPPKLDLPFRGGPADPGEWAWDHRVGLCVMIIVYLVAGIVFMSTKVRIGDRNAVQGFYVQFEEEKPPVTPRDRQSVERMENDDFSNIRNRVSNENAQQEAASARDRSRTGGREQQLLDDAAAVDKRLSANRNAWERGMSEERAIAQRRDGTNDTKDDARNTDTKQAGKVMVSFSLANPVRYADGPNGLFIPGYKCRGGGELILSVTVNRNGRVTDARLQKASASVDDCMISTAIDAAFASRFNVDGSAPDKHTGTIAYVFMPQ